MKGDGDGWYLRCCTRRRRPTRCQFLLCLFTRESPFGGVCIHMQYIIHGLYFMKRNNENDRFLFSWCLRTTQERRTQRRRNTTARKHLQHHKYVLITTLTTFIHIILLSTFELSPFSLPSTSPFFLHFTSYHPTVSNLHNGRCWNR